MIKILDEVAPSCLWVLSSIIQAKLFWPTFPPALWHNTVQKYNTEQYRMDQVWQQIQFMCDGRTDIRSYKAARTRQKVLPIDARTGVKKKTDGQKESLVKSGKNLCTTRKKARLSWDRVRMLMIQFGVKCVYISDVIKNNGKHKYVMSKINKLI